MNASGRAPQAWNAARFAGRTAMHERGWETVTIPGAVSGWRALSQRFGELPFADLFEPAIRYARDGFQVSPIVAEKWALAVPHMPRDLGWFEHFMPRGRAPHAGERFASPAFAATLEKIAVSDGESFYRGELAEAMVRHAQISIGAHTLDDFAAHTADWVIPLGYDYRGDTVHEIPPNGQGIAALMALGILENFDLAAMAPDSAAAAASGDRGDEARIRRCLSLRKRSAHDDSARLRAARSRVPGRPREEDRSVPRAGFRSRRAAQGGHRLPVRGRPERHDGVADPVELHGLRLRGGRARHRASACRIAAPVFRCRRGIRTRLPAASAHTTRSSPAS